MYTQETLNALTLALMFSNKVGKLCELYRRAGSATVIVENASALQDIMPDFNSSAFVIDRQTLMSCRDRAKKELEYLNNHSGRCLTPDMDDYPRRMMLDGCNDFPLALFYKGNADLNAAHIISVVGTRNSTPYGLDIVNNLLEDMAVAFPDLLVVSGLAYGTDINAHRAALNNGLPTVAVLAHGLDMLYPSIHRSTAQQMLSHGGLLTEYPTGSKPFSFSFLNRNRLIASISDATIVVESKEHGGALTTARCAASYNRAVFAFPGRVSDETSGGCNALIRTNEAELITSAVDLAKSLNWTPKARQATPLPSLFDPGLTSEEKALYDLLGSEPVPISLLVAQLPFSIQKIMQMLSDLEFRNLAVSMPGSLWRKVMGK